MSGTLGSSKQRVRWGSDIEFAELYEGFLDAVYGSLANLPGEAARKCLTRSVLAELRRRGATRILDCSAGTGFPALDLVAAQSDGLDVRCTDASANMLAVLVARAKAMDINIAQLVPERPSYESGRDSTESLVLDWGDLDQISDGYDYVLCRGNSLVYADTWGGGRAIATTEVIRGYLANMAAKIDLGGHLHVDAPWRLDLPQEQYRPVGNGAVSIWEQVTTESDCRHWRVDFKTAGNETVRFERFSTLLTIYEVKTILDDLGFEETEPFELRAERPGFGVIIAKKVN